MRRLTLLAVPALLLLTGGLAQASSVQVGSAAGLGANDFIDWGQLGDGTAVASPDNVLTNLGRTDVIADTTGFQGQVEGGDWIGIFNPGDKLLFNSSDEIKAGHSNSFEVDFASPIAGLGLGIQSNDFGRFVAQIDLFDSASTLLGSFTVTGDNLSTEDGSAPFLGAISDAVNVSRAVFSITANGGAGLGAGTLFLTDTPGGGVPSEVPEPATLSLTAIGAVMALRRRRKAQQL